MRLYMKGGDIKNLMRKIFTAKPPALELNYNREAFRAFTNSETYCFSPAYAKQRVEIKGVEKINAVLGKKPAIIAFMHHGSFFLIGGALAHQLGCNYSALVSTRNFSLINQQEQEFWRGVHKRSATLYGNELFYSDGSVRKLIRWLTNENLLGIVLDVREAGKERNESAFDMFGEKLYFQTGPARLASIAKVDVIPVVITYHPKKKRHVLTITVPIAPIGTEKEITQQILTAIEPYLQESRNQEFYDIVTRLKQRHN